MRKALLLLFFLFFLPPLVTVIYVSASQGTYNFGSDPAVGISDNGVVCTPSGERTYSFTTRAVKGEFTFYGGQFFSGPPVNSPSFSVQLNAQLFTGHQVYWAQDVALVKSSGSAYVVVAVDNLWNFTIYHAGLQGVTGKGIDNGTFYEYAYPTRFVTRAPFTVTAEMVAITQGGHPAVEMFFSFSNSTFSTSFQYDTVVIPVGGYSFFGVGLPSIYPDDIEWVVGGGGGGSSLSVNAWSATMTAWYRHDGTFYVLTGGSPISTTRERALLGYPRRGTTPR